MDEILTIPQVAKILKMSKSKVYPLIQHRQLPHIKLQRNVRVRMSDLEKWLQKHLVDGNSTGLAP